MYMSQNLKQTVSLEAEAQTKADMCMLTLSGLGSSLYFFEMGGGQNGPPLTHVFEVGSQSNLVGGLKVKNKKFSKHSKNLLMSAVFYGNNVISLEMTSSLVLVVWALKFA